MPVWESGGDGTGENERRWPGTRSQLPISVWRVCWTQAAASKCPCEEAVESRLLSDAPGSLPNSVRRQLCDLQHITYFLCASVSSPAQWGHFNGSNHTTVLVQQMAGLIVSTDRQQQGYQDHGQGVQHSLPTLLWLSPRSCLRGFASYSISILRRGLRTSFH